MTENSIVKALPELFKDVSPRNRGGSSWRKFMPDSAVTTPKLGPLLARPSIQGFIGRQPEQMHRTLSNVASDANSSPTKAICPHCPTNNPHHLGFAVWGLDMVGPLKGGSHKKKYLLVMVDKFTKWIEAKPVKTAEAGLVIDFISGVVHRYGVPHSIITDNGSNFTADEVKTWCANLGIKLDYALVHHPQTNGQVVWANGLIMSGIKPRLVRSLKESDKH